jgi:hypothetical protein
MGHTGTATAPIHKSNHTVENEGFSSSRFAQWTMVFFAELLNFFKPTKQGIENDPLLYKFRFK